jgi:hypothetical protein
LSDRRHDDLREEATAGYVAMTFTEQSGNPDSADAASAGAKLKPRQLRIRH